jgi:hypothetical protein
VTSSAPSAFDAFCRDAFDFLDRSGVRHLVIGGLAVIAVGEPRTTADVDVIGFLTDAEARQLIERAGSSGFELEPEVERRRLSETGTVRFRRGAFQLDIILASLPFEETAYSRSRRHRLFGRVISLPSPEDLILFKVLAGRDRDLIDAAGIVRRHGKDLDWTYVEDTMRHLCDLAEDLSAWRRLADARDRARAGDDS